MNRTARLCVLFVCILLPLAAADWPQWRGPERDGISKEADLLTEWPAGGPPLVWKVTGLGDGYASVAVAAGRVYTQGQFGSRQAVLANAEARRAT